MVPPTSISSVCLHAPLGLDLWAVVENTHNQVRSRILRGRKARYSDVLEPLVSLEGARRDQRRQPGQPDLDHGPREPAHGWCSGARQQRHRFDDLLLARVSSIRYQLRHGAQFRLLFPPSRVPPGTVPPTHAQMV
ncbi:hypothetical protein C8034_v000292 [Colletotrichum sidae]|uniref:Uncharacterized protein n=1 Tax=Colletotrichum sidae TaxID=1347389 RepID=A0A4R8TGB1_9PEZI|nr:hypothetical protein C8034_v000292 [Colletotrichum sidae]